MIGSMLARPLQELDRYVGRHRARRGRFAVGGRRRNQLFLSPLQLLERRLSGNQSRREKLMLFGGVGLGSALMYLLDPDRGKRRRGLLRDKVVSTVHQSEDAIAKTSRDVLNRTRGMSARVRSPAADKEIPEQVLVARIRSKLGRVVSHPGAIEAAVDQGRVTLRGHILSHEVGRLLAMVRAIPGITEVDSQLQQHKQAGDIPDLQGGRPRTGWRPDLLQKNWAPASRLFAGVVGGGLGLLGARRRGPLGAALSALGLGLLARGITNTELKRITGVGGGRRAVDIQKTVNVNLPPEEVYAFWSNFENFPRFMSHLREVRDLGNGRSRWVVDGPAGMPVQWVAEITRAVPNQILAWKSVPGSLIANAGIIHFDRTDEGGTRIDIKISYNPPAGAVGHVFASLFGANPKQQMNDDLIRLKSLLESGKTSAEDQQVSRESIEGRNDQRELGASGTGGGESAA